MPPPSCRPPPTIANGCSFCGLCSFAVTHLNGTGLVSQQPRAARDVLVSWVHASHQPPAQRSNTAGRRFRARSGEHAQPTGPTPKHCANHRGQSWAAPCRWQQASQLRASCGQEVQQPEGRSPLDTHMAGRAPTKRMRGDSHAESPAPRCRAVPARTHLRSRLTPCPPPTGPPAARFCSQTLA